QWHWKRTDMIWTARVPTAATSVAPLTASSSLGRTGSNGERKPVHVDRGDRRSDRGHLRHPAEQGTQVLRSGLRAPPRRGPGAAAQLHGQPPLGPDAEAGQQGQAAPAGTPASVTPSSSAAPASPS